MLFSKKYIQVAFVIIILSCLLVAVISCAYFITSLTHKDSDNIIKILYQDAPIQNTKDNNTITHKVYYVTENEIQVLCERIEQLVRKKAESEFDSKLGLLFAIISIIGISWPLVIALIQINYSNASLEAIKDQGKQAFLKATDAFAKAEREIELVQKAIMDATSAKDKAYQAINYANGISASTNYHLYKCYKFIGETTVDDLFMMDAYCKALSNFLHAINGNVSFLQYIHLFNELIDKIKPILTHALEKDYKLISEWQDL